MSMTDHAPNQLRPPVPQANADDEPFLSVVIPALNEADNIPPLVERIRETVTRFTDRFEIIFVCDGYADSTSRAVTELRTTDGRIKLLRLSRSFGHQNALLAGLDHVSGRVVITMDADLQHPPETVVDLLLKWEQGYDVVHAIRRPARRHGSLTRRWRSLAYTLLRCLCEVDIVPQSADFKLYDRSAVRAMCRLREHGRFNRGLARWIGFRHAAVYYDEARRHKGRTAYSFVKRLLLLLNGIFSLSSKPLQYLGVVGLGISVLAGVYLIVILIGWALDVEAYRLVAGWASTVGIVLLVGGVQLTGLWLMGQYLARTYDEVKGRPCYIVADSLGLPSAAPSADEPQPRALPRRRESAGPADHGPPTHTVGVPRRAPAVPDELPCPVACDGGRSPASLQSQSVEHELQTSGHS